MRFLRTFFVRRRGPVAVSNAWIYKVAADKVTGSHNGFPLVIDLSVAPSSFWNSVRKDAGNPGGNIRLFDAGGNRLPVDIHWIDPINRAGHLWTRAPVLQTGTEISMTAVALDQVQPGVAAAYGQRAVWVDFEYVNLFGHDPVDRAKGLPTIMAQTGGGPPVTAVANTMIEVGNIRVPPAEYQGWAWNPDLEEWVGTGTTKLLRMANNATSSVAGTVLQTRSSPWNFTGIDVSDGHCGGAVYYNGMVLFSISTGSTPAGKPNGYYNYWLVAFKASDLTFLSKTWIGADDLTPTGQVPGYEAGMGGCFGAAGVGIDPRTNNLITAQYTNCLSAAEFSIDPLDGKCTFIRKINLIYANPATISTTFKFQGITVWRGHLWGSDNLKRGLVNFRYNAGESEATHGNLVGQVVSEPTAQEMEQVSVKDDRLVWTVRPSSGVSKLYFMDQRDPLPAMPGPSPVVASSLAGGLWTGQDSTGDTTPRATVAGLPALQDFTLGFTGRNNNSSSGFSRAMVSLNGPASAVKMVERGSSTVQLFDGEAYSGSTGIAAPATNSTHRYTGVINSSGLNRKLYVDGVKANDSAMTVAAPADLTTLSVGYDPNNLSQGGSNHNAYLYLRPGAPLADTFYAAEYNMLSNPSTFGSIT